MNPDPSRLFGLAEGVYAVDAVTVAACRLDLFNRLADGPSDLGGICRSLDLAERPARVVLTLLCALDLLHEDEHGGYELTPLARQYLTESSPWNLTPVFGVLMDRPSAEELLTVLRTGKPLAAQFEAAGFDGPGFDGPGFDAPGFEGPDEEMDWAAAMGESDFAAEFLAMTDSRNAYLADVLADRLDLSGARHVVDVGGGSGIYACALARRNPELRATVLEQPPVDEVARHAVAARGMADRVAVQPGDMLGGDLPAADVHLFSNVLHDWGEQEVQALLGASFEALPSGGRIVVHDTHLDAGNARQVAAYSVLLMVYTAGRCYSVDEIMRSLTRAGFADAVHEPTAAGRSMIIAAKP